MGDKKFDRNIDLEGIDIGKCLPTYQPKTPAPAPEPPQGLYYRIDKSLGGILPGGYPFKFFSW